MAESQSRYSIIQELVEKKQEIDARIIAMHDRLVEEETKIKRATEDLENLKKSVNQEEQFADRAKSDIDEAMKAIQKISKESEK